MLQLLFIFIIIFMIINRITHHRTWWIILQLPGHTRHWMWHWQMWHNWWGVLELAIVSMSFIKLMKLSSFSSAFLACSCSHFILSCSNLDGLGSVDGPDCVDGPDKGRTRFANPGSICFCDFM